MAEFELARQVRILRSRCIVNMAQIESQASRALQACGVDVASERTVEAPLSRHLMQLFQK